MSVHQMASYMRQARSNPKIKLKVPKKTVHNTNVLVNGTYISPDSLFNLITTKTSNQNYGSKYGGANKSVDQAIATVQELTGNPPDPKLIAIKRKKHSELQSSTPTRSASSRATSSSTNRSASSGSSSTSASSGSSSTSASSASSSGRTVRETAESVVPMQEIGGGSVTNQQAQAVESDSGLSTVALVGIGVGATALLGGILYIALSD